MILAGVLVATLLWANLRNRYVWVVLFVTVGFGAIGFYDDFLKVTKQSHKGFSGRSRLAIEAVIAVARLRRDRLHRHAGRSRTSSPCPSSRTLFDLGWFFVVFGGFVIVGAGNAVNITDGLDGLAIVPVMIAAGTFGFIAYLAGNAIFANYLQIHFVPGAGELAVICGALIGAGLGFLWFNAPPAQIFMGDTGSLALGGLLGTVAVATKHEIVLAHRRRAVRARDPVGDHPGRLVQAHRQARLPDGADPPPFRAARLDRAAGRDPLLDHLRRAGAGRASRP